MYSITGPGPGDSIKGRWDWTSWLGVGGHIYDGGDSCCYQSSSFLTECERLTIQKPIRARGYVSAYLPFLRSINVVEVILGAYTILELLGNQKECAKDVEKISEGDAMVYTVLGRGGRAL